MKEENEHLRALSIPFHGCREGPWLALDSEGYITEEDGHVV